MTTTIGLSDEQIEALGDEIDELRGRVIMDLGERDVDYIRRVIKAQRGLEVAGPRTTVRRLPAPPRGWAEPRRWRWPRSWTTWRSATTSCTASTTG